MISSSDKIRRFFLLVTGAVVLVVLFLALGGLKDQITFFNSGCPDYEFDLPGHVDPPLIHSNNCINPAKVELGRRLFYEKRLSINEKSSCSTCHDQKRAFSDGKKNAVGTTKMVHPRNAPGLANVAYFSILTWNEPRLTRLENQALNPLLAEAGPVSIVELGMSRKENVIIDRLNADERYPEMFQEAFGSSQIDVSKVVQALEAFEMTLLSYQSPYDQGEMSDTAKRGQKVFKESGCSNCHSGQNFNEPPGYQELRQELSKRNRKEPRKELIRQNDDLYKVLFRNIGLYNIGGKGDYPDYKLHGRSAKRKTQGLYAHTKAPDDRGRFRIPSLRNVALTAPYMHDGSMATLQEVVEHFNRGGRLISSGPFAGDGKKSELKSPLIAPLDLSAGQKKDLIAFLHALTDECFINNPKLSDPERPAPVMPKGCTGASRAR